MLAYANPLIAVLLGCTVGREPFSHEVLMAGGLIIAAVVLVLRGATTKTKTELETVAAQPKACPTPE